jgi:hypothetical protein
MGEASCSRSRKWARLRSRQRRSGDRRDLRRRARTTSTACPRPSAWLFAGSDRGGERAAALCTLIVTAKLNGIDPRAWLADVLRRIADHPALRLDALLPWNCTGNAAKRAA